MNGVRRSEAVRHIQDAGYLAFKKCTELGEVIECGRVSQITPGLIDPGSEVTIFRTRNGWGIQAKWILSVIDYNQNMIFQDAIDLSIDILSSPFFPFASGDLITTLARTEGGN